MSRVYIDALQRLERGQSLVDESGQARNNARKTQSHLRVCLLNSGLVEAHGHRLIVTKTGRLYLKFRGDWLRITAHENALPDVAPLPRFSIQT